MRFKEFSHRLHRAFKAFWAAEPPTNAALPHSPEATPHGVLPEAPHEAPSPPPVADPVGNVAAPPKPGTWTQAPAPMAWQQQRTPAPQTWRQAPVMSAQPGIQCPRCQTRFEILIPVLLSGMPLCCPGCGLELKVNREKSEESLAALEKLHGNFEKATEMMNRAKGKT
jgi:hypothetical protein